MVGIQAQLIWYENSKDVKNKTFSNLGCLNYLIKKELRRGFR